MLTTSGQWLKFNDHFCNLVGYSADELRRLSHDHLFPAAEAKRIAAFFAQVVQRQGEYAKITTQYVHKNGANIWVELRSCLIESTLNVVPYIVLLIEDISQSLRDAKIARETAENYRLLIQSATERAIIRTDEKGIVTSWNAGAERILGFTEKEILHHSSEIFLTPEDTLDGRLEMEMQQARLFGQLEDDRWHLRKDGTRFWASGVLTPCRDDHGQIHGYVKVLRDLTDKKLIEQRMLYLSEHDSLTGLPNRKKFHDELDRVIAEAKIARTEVAILFVDLDRFKLINDSLGHHIGDLLLTGVAQRLAASVRKTDFLARLSGDEFGIIRTDLKHSSEAESLAATIVDRLAGPFSLDGTQVHTAASIGATIFPRDAVEAKQLLINADLAMYRAKSRGRSAYAIYTEDLNSEAARRHALEESLRVAWKNKEFYLYYQPQINLETNQMRGIEALLRWNHEENPFLTTSEFVTLADETGMIVPIGEWVLRTACRQLKAWHDLGFAELRMAVNLSYRQIQEQTFLAMVNSVLSETGVNPHSLELEITEGVLMENTANNMSLLRALREKGIKLSIDDFGTGFSSLSYLKNFPLDSLKIDQVFIKTLPENHNDAAITSAIIGLAHSMKLRVVAEGVETEQQAHFLAQRHCDYAQGFFFSKPVPPELITKQLIAASVT